MVPQTATWELIISLCYCPALWKKPSIRRCFVCHMNLQGTLQGASHCSPRHLLLLSALDKDIWTSGWGGTASCPALPVFRVAATLCCWMLHGAVLCNWENTGRMGSNSSTASFATQLCNSALFAWFTKMWKICKIWCCLKIIYVRAQEESDELHWERGKLDEQATQLRMKLNLGKHKIKHFERNDLSHKYTQMVPKLAAVSCNKELEFVANSSQSAQRLGKQKHLAALRMSENYMHRIRACTYMSTYGSDFQSV